MISLWAAFLVLIGTIVGSVANIIIKKETNKHSFFGLFQSGFFWMGVIMYVVSVVPYTFALRREELSVLYPLVSTAYVWTTLLSIKYLGEKMNKWKWISLAGIMLGVTLIGIGS